MSFGEYQPTRYVVRWGKVITFLSSLISIFLLFLYICHSDVLEKGQNFVFLIFGALGLLEIFLLSVVILEIKKLLPVVLGYASFILFYSLIGFIFCLCFGIVQLVSKCDPKTEGKELPMMNFIFAFPIIMVFTILYFLRFLGIWLVYRRSRVTDGSQIVKNSTNGNSLISNQN